MTFNLNSPTETPVDVLAEWINKGHTAIKLAVRRLAIHVAQVGAWLIAAKEKCQHGEWLGWLEENCPEIERTTAWRYMELYEKAISNVALMQHLTPTQAYRALGIVKGYSEHFPAETPPLMPFRLDTRSLNVRDRVDGYLDLNAVPTYAKYRI